MGVDQLDRQVLWLVIPKKSHQATVSQFAQRVAEVATRAAPLSGEIFERRQLAASANANSLVVVAKASPGDGPRVDGAQVLPSAR